jgi:hypothetical protein
MKSERDIVIYRKAFSDLFNDFAWFADSAASGQNPSLPGDTRFACAAILYGGLCVEAAANCCLNAVGLAKESEKDLEHAKTFSKFDVFLVGSGAARTLDRGHPIVEAISELPQVRNGFVHPKVSESRYVYVGTKLTKTIDYRHKRVDIPVDRTAWTAFDAHKVYVLVHDFMNYLFFDVLGLDIKNLDHRDVAARVLSSEIEHFTIKHSYTKPGKSRVLVNPVSGIVALTKKYDLDNAFLGWYASDRKNSLRLPQRSLGV